MKQIDMFVSWNTNIVVGHLLLPCHWLMFWYYFFHGHMHEAHSEICFSCTLYRQGIDFYGDIMIKPFKKQLAKTCMLYKSSWWVQKNGHGAYFYWYTNSRKYDIEDRLFCAMWKHGFIYTFITWVKEGVLHKRRWMTRLIEIIIHDSIPSEKRTLVIIKSNRP